MPRVSGEARRSQNETATAGRSAGEIVLTFDRQFVVVRGGLRGCYLVDIHTPDGTHFLEVNVKHGGRYGA
jgi:hypothetical protein